MDQNKISIVIPTLNRPKDLSLVVKCILKQTIVPGEIIIVDQSEDNNSELTIKEIFADKNKSDKKLLLNYIRDTKITGAAQARNRGIDESTGNIIFFFDDDVVLDNDFLKYILEDYDACPEVGGMGGIITNYSFMNNLQIKLFNCLFFQGIFKDNRRTIFTNFHKYLKPIATDKLSGGCCSYKKQILAMERFDENFDKMFNGYSFGEDIDLSMRISKKSTLIIDTRAKLIHNSHTLTTLRKTNENYIFLESASWTYIFFKNFKKSIFGWICFLWLCYGWTIRGIMGIFKRNNLVIQFLLKGVICGYKQYRLFNNNKHN